MNVLGWFIAVCGVAGVVFGLRMLLKLKKMTTVPFRKPSEIAAMGAAAADAKGLVSTEGTVAPGTYLTAPMSGEPCLAYEYEIELRWEKDKVTEKGTETEKGKNRLADKYEGAKIEVTDGGGSVHVDLSKKPDAKFEQSSSSTVKVGVGTVPSVLTFGKLEYQRDRLPDDRRTVAFVGTERIIKVPPTLYALGALDGTTIGEPKGAFAGKLALSAQGREHLLAVTKRNRMLGFVIGGVLAVGGTGLGIFGPKAQATPGAASCDDFTGTTDCKGRMFEKSGIDYKWTVAKAGTYTVTVKMPPGLKYPIDPNLTISDDKGNEIASNTGPSMGADATVTMKFEPGSYKLNVRDFAKTTIDGGYSFLLSVVSPDVAPEPAAAPATATATAAAPEPAPAPAAAAPAPAPAPTATATAAAAVPTPVPSAAAAAGACQRALRCCREVTPSASVAACDAYATPGLTDESCVSALDGLKRAARALGKTSPDCE